MDVLVIGSGGREHALCHALRRSRRLGRLFILPGNPGTAALGTNVRGDVSDIARALEIARREKIDLTIVGPEDPLAGGLVDAFEAAGHRIFGPCKAAAELESNKAFAKQLMRQYAVPTAEARIFDDFELAQQYIASRDDAVVIKAAGLAKGKGVVVCEDPSDGLIAAEKMLVHGQFGAAGRQIVVEERLLGREASLLAIVDGHTSYLLETAQDHKRLRDGDAGPNTGGMGAFSPSPVLTDALVQQVQSQILVPVLDGLVRQEMPYRGVLYIGLMVTSAGPKVLEFNCRFGDPETQVILPRLKSDLLDLLEAAVTGQLEQVEVRWDPRPALCVVMASAGYPDVSTPAVPIRGIPEPTDDVIVFHAGTAKRGSELVTAGGRVLGVTALGETLSAAHTRVYETVARIQFDGAQFRTDIGQPAAD